MAGRWRVNNDWLIRLKYPNLSAVLVIPMQPSPLIIKPSNKMESLISRKNKMNNLEALLMETGNTIIRIRKDLMGLSLIFLSMLNKARSQKYSKGTITSGNPISMELQKDSDRLWPSHVLHLVRWYSTRLEGRSLDFDLMIDS